MKKGNGIIPDGYGYWLLLLWTGMALWGMAAGRDFLSGVANLGMATTLWVGFVLMLRCWDLQHDSYIQGQKDGLYEAFKAINKK